MAGSGLLAAGAGGASLIAGGPVVGTPATFDIQNIPGGSTHLLIVGFLRSTNAGNALGLSIQLNGDSANHYDEGASVNINGTLTTTGTGIPVASFGASGNTIFLAGTTQPGLFSGFSMLIPGYSTNGTQKQAEMWSSVSIVNTLIQTGMSSGVYSGTSPITRVTLTPAAGNINTGSILSVYGLQ